jgi:hypothetical protein
VLEAARDRSVPAGILVEVRTRVRGVALSQLLANEGSAAALVAGGALAPKPPHFPAKAQSVIFLFMQGGPSHIETFDPKPELARLDGAPLPDSFKDLDLAQINTSDGKLMGSAVPFKKHGASGLEISDLFLNLAEHADELAVIRSCYHNSFIHGPALSLMNSGSLLLGHPSVGSWVVYGLGCESDNLPAYVAMTDSIFRNGSSTFSSGFLPAVYQGTHLQTEGRAIQNLVPPPQVGLAQQRILLDQVAASRDALRRQPPRCPHRQLRARLPHADGGAGAYRPLAGNAGGPQALWTRR